MSIASYPVSVRASLDSRLSRWLWLVKWVLLIPHYIVLFVLWIGFVFASIGAFLAIVFTGVYPPRLFRFNVGVLRWTWRVNFYAYGGLGTDRYPPFSLSDVADYPAHFDVRYPGRLSRGLVLVKWWLLAIPHYLIVGVLAGGVAWTAQTAERGNSSYSGGIGLIDLLVLIAAVTLTVTGKYPKGIFDFILGCNRWVLRVIAYAALMTDEYPPFRLDLGGEDPSDGDDLTPSG